MARQLPGIDKPKRLRPKFHWELLACGVSGHELIGLDAKQVGPDDALVVRQADGVRWHRCVRCDSWLPLNPPPAPTRDHPPARDEIALPLRGRALRDKVVLRIIAIDRAVHFVLLAIVAVAIFVFAAHRGTLRAGFYRVIADFQGGLVTHPAGHGLLGRVDKLVSLQSSTLKLVGVGVLVYAIVEGLEAVGLWMMKRWAEYLTLIATAALLPLEIYELSRRLSPLKVIGFIVNVAVVIYLLFAKRLFGLRGGAKAEEELRAADSGWASLEETAPPRGVPA